MQDVVFYEPETGKIVYSCQIDGRSIPIEKKRLSLEALVVDIFSSEYSLTHMVVDGQLVEKPHAN